MTDRVSAAETIFLALADVAPADREALLQQRVHGDDFTLVVPRQQKQGHADSPEDISGHDLQESQVAEVRESWNADERECACLGRYDRKQHGPPRDLPSGDEIVFRVLLVTPQPDAKRCGAGEIEDKNQKIEGGESSHFTTLDEGVGL